ncbi:uncharacterized protein LOC117182594 [Belonocnema kinseyi]|uniref:uncharacterized protein LOC117182594 n=1 Tax=Belonocnema kinseyi TaxID=2817044 RepID=UPI00143D2549|nr:uncharacterized protein LOC117182594 [Belonocnema kinseyi]
MATLPGYRERSANEPNDDNNDEENTFNEETDALLRDYRRQIIQLEMENRSLKKSKKLQIGEANPATNEIHACHGVWIDRDTYDAIQFQPKINAQKFTDFSKSWMIKIS